MKDNDKSQITEHLANEQTFLSWLRTGMEVMAFGFGAIKFSLFASTIMGIVLVGVGTIMILASYIRYIRTVKHLREGQYHYSTVLLTITAIILLCISAVLLYYIIDAYFK